MVYVPSHSSPLLLIILAAVLGLLAGYLMVPFASRRTQRQPVDDSRSEESLLVDLLYDRPNELVRLLPALRVEDFLDQEQATRFGDLLGLVGDLVVALQPPDLLDLGEAAPSRALQRAVRQAAITAGQDDELMSHRVAHDVDFTGWSRRRLKDPVMYLAGRVVNQSLSRAQNTPRSPFVEENGRLVRQYVAPRPMRYGVVAVLAGVANVTLALAIYHTVHSTLAQVLAVLTATVFIAVCAEVSLVDFDTYYLDLPVFWIGAAVSWLMAIAVQLIDHHPHQLLAGGVTAVAVAVSFEGLSLLYYLATRKAQGFGDTLIALISVGVPGALTGSWQVGLYSIVAAGLSASAEWAYRARRQGATKMTPIAFGPHLALGWLYAALLLLAVGVL